MPWHVRCVLLASLIASCRAVQIVYPAAHDAADLTQPLLVIDDNTTEDVSSLMTASPWDPLMRWGLPSLHHKQGMSHERDAILCRLKSKFPVAQVQQMFPHSKTCSVVSSSGVMLFHNHSTYIDSAETVLRFNVAPSAGKFGKQVGSKESVRIMNEGGPSRLVAGNLKPDLDVNTVQHLVVIPVIGGPDLKKMATLRTKYPNKKLELLDKKIFLASEDALRSIYDTAWFKQRGVKGVRFDATCGLVGMLAMLSVCDEVHAFGMAATPRGNGAAYHYFDGEWSKANANSNPWHTNFPAEKDLWRRMSLNTAKLDQTDVVEMPGFSQLTC